jgi:hypothetical protein
MVSVVQTYELQPVNLWFGRLKPMVLMTPICKNFATRWRSAGSFFAIKKPPGLHSGGGSEQINKIIDYGAIIQIAKNN